jgi:rod shape determining protein RodA
VIDRRLITSFDVKFLLVMLVIAGIGLLSIYSVTGPHHQTGVPIYLKQLCWIGIGLVVFFAFLLVDYHTLSRHAYLIYAVSLGLLVIVNFMGRTGQGAQRWLSIGFFDIQPSELLKICLLLVLAKDFSGRLSRHGIGLAQIPVPALLTAVPVFLVLNQPDLGTALAILFLFLAMVFLVGPKSRLVIFGFLFSLMLFPFFWHFFWNALKDYQRDRLLTFLNPTADPLGTGYHIIQSKIAVGSGGLMGQGFLEGTQSQLQFLPMGHTDFIFAVFAEEWGFFGVTLLLGLYLILLLWGVEAAYKAKDSLGTLIAGGAVSVLVIYLAINIGMTLGITPVVGLPLPLMSYGGSSMLTTMALLGLILNVKMRRFKLFY